MIEIESQKLKRLEVMTMPNLVNCRNHLNVMEQPLVCRILLSSLPDPLLLQFRLMEYCMNLLQLKVREERSTLRNLKKLALKLHTQESKVMN